MAKAKRSTKPKAKPKFMIIDGEKWPVPRRPHVKSDIGAAKIRAAVRAVIRERKEVVAK